MRDPPVHVTSGATGLPGAGSSIVANGAGVSFASDRAPSAADSFVSCHAASVAAPTPAYAQTRCRRVNDYPATR